jgi:transketolase
MSPKAAPDRAAEMRSVADRIRGDLVEMSHRAGTPHLGSSLSCVDILVAAYWGALSVNPKRPNDPGRDRLILSKGHAVSALYAALAHRGYFPIADLEHFDEAGGNLPQQPSPGCAPGVELATGSLGHGLPVAVGLMLGARIQKQAFKTIVVMSDGECNEGSVWEAAMLAAAHNLGSLAAVIDYNKWQATGRSNEIMALSPLREKWEAFGWRAFEMNGHDAPALAERLRGLPDASGKPLAIIANTIKGKGVSFMQDDNNWHYRVPTAEEVLAAKKELGLA